MKLLHYFGKSYCAVDCFRAYFLIIFLVLLGGCSCSNITSSDEVSTDLLPITIYDIDSWPAALANLIQDEISIDCAAVTHDTLQVTVSYSGGCTEHEFELIADESIMYTAIPSKYLYLGHNAHGDSCEEVVNVVLLFDLSGVIKRYAPLSDQLILGVVGLERRNCNGTSVITFNP